MAQYIVGSAISDGAPNKYAMVQAWNKPSSGKNLFMTDIDVAWSAGDALVDSLNDRNNGFDFNFNSVCLGDIIRNMIDVDASNTADTEIELRSLQAVLPFPSSRLFYEKWPEGAFSSIHTKFTQPLKIPPGFGLLVRLAQPNTYNIVSFQGYLETC